MIKYFNRKQSLNEEDGGFSLLDLVTGVSIVLILMLVTITGFMGLNDQAKKSAVNRAANEVYDKSYGLLLSSNSDPETVEKEFNSKNKNIVSNVDTLPNDRIRVTSYYKSNKNIETVLVTPANGTGKTTPSEEAPEDEEGNVIRDITTTMTYKCSATTTGLLPVADLDADTVVKLNDDVVPVVDGSTTIYDSNTSNNTLRKLRTKNYAQSVTMNSGVEYKLTIVGTFETLSQLGAFTNTFGNCLISVDHIGMDSGLLRIGHIGGTSLVNVPTEIPATVTNLTLAFAGATIFNDPNVSQWNVENVRSFENMFNNNQKFNQDLSAWNMNNATDVSRMFFSASVFNNGGKPLTWGSTTRNITNMNYMFHSAAKFNQDISSWNTRSVNSTSYMFTNAELFNNGGVALDWADTSSFSNMYGMFYTAHSFNQDVNNWDVSNATNMDSVFSGSGFNKSLSNWDTRNVETMFGMFRQNTFFNQNISSFNTGKVKNMSQMFYGATGYNNAGQKITWNTSKVENMSFMFATATSFDQDVSDWDVSNVTNMNSMFVSAKIFNNGGKTLDWNIQKITDLGSMFNGAESFNQPINSWDVSNVTNMNSMFSNAKKFNQPLDNWNVSKVSSVTSMFLNASNFEQDLSGWKLPLVKAKPSSFNTNSKLTKLPQWGATV